MDKEYLPKSKASIIYKVRARQMSAYFSSFHCHPRRAGQIQHKFLFQTNLTYFHKKTPNNSHKHCNEAECYKFAANKINPKTLKSNCLSIPRTR